MKQQYAVCPTCQAGVKQECRSRSGTRTITHVARIALDEVSQPRSVCEMCGDKIVVQVYKGSGICGTNCQKIADAVAAGLGATA